MELIIIVILSFLAINILRRIFRSQGGGIIFRRTQDNGKYSESLVSNKLSELPDDYHCFSNLLFKSNDRSCQIDQLVVSPYGVFVIETKGYGGAIYGGENSEYWTQYFKRTNYKFYNPILQNGGHIRFLSYLLKDIGINKFISIVVFDNRADLRVQLHQQVVVNRCNLKSAILNFSDKVITEEQVERIIQRINERAIQQQDEAEAAQKHTDYAVNRKIEASVNELQNRCPRCGASLVMRKGKYGEFYGCSNYPRCNYRKNLQ